MTPTLTLLPNPAALWFVNGRVCVQPQLPSDVLSLLLLGSDPSILDRSRSTGSALFCLVFDLQQAGPADPDSGASTS